MRERMRPRDEQLLHNCKRFRNVPPFIRDKSRCYNKS